MTHRERQALEARIWAQVRKVIACHRAGYTASLREIHEAGKAAMMADLQRRLDAVLQRRKKNP